MRRLDSFLENPRLYDLVQSAVGAAQIRAKLVPHVQSFAGSRVLDVGAGTGGYVETVPGTAGYVALDLDPRKLARLSQKHPHVRTVVGDATRLELERDSFNHALVVFLAHHLDDDGLSRLFDGLRSTVSGTVVLLDPLRDPALRSRLLWGIDRGSYPRTAEQLLSALDRGFTIDHEERFRIHHRYLLCVASPRPTTT